MNIFKRVFNFFKPIVKIIIEGALALAMGALKDVALKTIAELEQGNLSNEEKRKEAFKRIKEYAKLKGMETKDSAVNFVIETALQQIKGNIKF